MRARLMWSVATAVVAACSIYDDTLLPVVGVAGAGGTTGGSLNAGSGGVAGLGGAATDSGGSGADKGLGGSETSGGSAGTTSTGGSDPVGGQGGVENQPLGKASVVDDFEDGDFRIDYTAGRRGDWFVANDGSADGTMLPALYSDIPSELEVTDPRADASTFALHASGSGFAEHADSSLNWGALVGCNLSQIVADKESYDASAYCGIRFLARGSFVSGTNKRPLHVRISDQWTIPDAGLCGDTWNCNSHAGASFVIPSVDEWTSFEVSFDEMTHPMVPDHPELDRATIYSIEYTFEGKGSFDVWIDDIAFVECSGP